MIAHLQKKQDITAFASASSNPRAVHRKGCDAETFLTRWLEDVHKRSIRPRTYERYEETVRLHLVPGIGHHQIQKLLPQHLQAFYAQRLEEGLSTTTVVSFHNVLHKALETAVRWNLIARNPCDLVSPPRRKRFEIRLLSLQQIHQLLAAARGHRLEALFILALSTGMRRGEMLGLKMNEAPQAIHTMDEEYPLCLFARFERDAQHHTGKVPQRQLQAVMHPRATRTSFFDALHMIARGGM